MGCPVCGGDICNCADVLHDAFIGGGPSDPPPAPPAQEVHHVSSDLPSEPEAINISPEVHRIIHSLDHEFDDKYKD